MGSSVRCSVFSCSGLFFPLGAGNASGHSNHIGIRFGWVSNFPPLRDVGLICDNVTCLASSKNTVIKSGYPCLRQLSREKLA